MTGQLEILLEMKALDEPISVAYLSIQYVHFHLNDCFQRALNEVEECFESAKANDPVNRTHLGGSTWTFSKALPCLK